jgi:hypothetical protein
MLRPTSNEGKKYERRTPLVKKKKKSRSEALCPPTKKKKKEKKGRTTLPLKEEREIRFFIEKKNHDLQRSNHSNSNPISEK